MKKIVLFLMVVIILFVFTACNNTNASSDIGYSKNNLEEKYMEFLEQYDEVYYTFKDIDGDSRKELIIMENTLITIYISDEKNIKKIGSYDFVTGTVRLLYSDDAASYPGIFYYTVGGGIDHYGYLTIRDNKLVLENLWEENYAAESIDSQNRIKEISSDKELINASKESFKNDNDIDFITFKNNER